LKRVNLEGYLRKILKKGGKESVFSNKEVQIVISFFLSCVSNSFLADKIYPFFTFKHVKIMPLDLLGPLVWREKAEKKRTIKWDLTHTYTLYYSKLSSLFIIFFISFHSIDGYLNGITIMLKLKWNFSLIRRGSAMQMGNWEVYWGNFGNQNPYHHILCNTGKSFSFLLTKCIN